MVNITDKPQKYNNTTESAGSIEKAFEGTKFARRASTRSYFCSVKQFVGDNFPTITSIMTKISAGFRDTIRASITLKEKTFTIISDINSKLERSALGVYEMAKRFFGWKVEDHQENGIELRIIDNLPKQRSPS